MSYENRNIRLSLQVGGWPDKVVSVSNVPFDEHTCIPHAMTLEDIVGFKKSFAAAVQRSLIAGFDVGYSPCRSALKTR